jgi:hypothetical protein
MACTGSRSRRRQVCSRSSSRLTITARSIPARFDDPRVNFSISTRGEGKGINHLRIQVDDDAELAVVAARLARAGENVFNQKSMTCCYAQSNKPWVLDPQGVPWETFPPSAPAPFTVTFKRRNQLPSPRLR